MASLETRPYRSHKVPACDVCRQRKIRCHVDIPLQPCRSCRERGQRCSFSQTRDQAKEGPALLRSTKRLRTSSNIGSKHRSAYDGLPHAAHEQFTSPVDSSSLIVQPTMAEDIEVLQSCLTPSSPAEAVTAKPYSRVTHASGESIMYLTIPRWRKGRRLFKDPGKAQREIMEQVLGPYKEDVVKL